MQATKQLEANVAMYSNSLERGQKIPLGESWEWVGTLGCNVTSSAVPWCRSSTRVNRHHPMVSKGKNSGLNSELES